MTPDQQRAWLREYGKAHGYPGILVVASDGKKYALGYDGSAEIWNMAIGANRDEVIDAAVQALQAQGSEEVA